MAPKRVFASFDLDHDDDLRNLLVEQSRHPDSPFVVADSSVKEPMAGDWRVKVRKRMRQVDMVVILCGEHTSDAATVNAELKIAKEESIPCFLLWGRAGTKCSKPTSADASERVYRWTWESLTALLRGSR